MQANCIYHKSKAVHKPVSWKCNVQWVLHLSKPVIATLQKWENKPLQTFESQWKTTYCKSKSSKGHCQSKVTRKRYELWRAAKETKSDGQMPTGRKPLTGSATMWAGAQLFLNRKGLTSYAWVSHALPWNLLHFSTLICAVIFVMSVSKKYYAVCHLAQGWFVLTNFMRQKHLKNKNTR